LADVVLAPSTTSDPERVRLDLRSFEQTLADSPELAIALGTPSISRSRKRGVVGRLAQTIGLSNASRNFLKVLIDHDRIADLTGILDAYDKVVDERRGIQRVEVTSVRDLNERQRNDLERQLEMMTGKKISLNVKVDGELVGGLVARVGSTVYDGSVRGQLAALRRQLETE
jgi:F-type H+-transporting ATPase subunit delta